MFTVVTRLPAVMGPPASSVPEGVGVSRVGLESGFVVGVSLVPPTFFSLAAADVALGSATTVEGFTIFCRQNKRNRCFGESELPEG